MYRGSPPIGEVFHPDPTVTSFFVGGKRGWDNIDNWSHNGFDFPLFFAIRDVLLRNAPQARSRTSSARIRSTLTQTFSFLSLRITIPSLR